jgi:hypothetical protein
MLSDRAGYALNGRLHGLSGRSGGSKKMALTILFTTEGDSHGILIFISLRRKRPVETLLIKTASAT